MMGSEGEVYLVYQEELDFRKKKSMQGMYT